MLDNLIRKNNPYAESFEMMHEVERQEIENKKRNGQKPREVRMILTGNKIVDKNRYNLPTCNEVAVVFVGNDGVLPIDRDVCIFSCPQKKISKIPLTSKHADPMTYPLIFPCGGEGWHPYIKLMTIKNKNLRMCDFYKYRFAMRGKFNQYLQMGRITQQYVIDAWFKVEHSKLYFIRKSQAKLRTHMYRGLIDYLTNKSEKENTKIGKMVILPSSFTGSPRACREKLFRFDDSLTSEREI
ncbi:hypothetical protein TKK_0014701 [Trichogramma kaykai]